MVVNQQHRKTIGRIHYRNPRIGLCHHPARGQKPTGTEKHTVQCRLDGLNDDQRDRGKDERIPILPICQRRTQPEGGKDQRATSNLRANKDVARPVMGGERGWRRDDQENQNNHRAKMTKAAPCTVPHRGGSCSSEQPHMDAHLPRPSVASGGATETGAWQRDCRAYTPGTQAGKKEDRLLLELPCNSTRTRSV
jgi:hypothetical protein